MTAVDASRIVEAALFATTRPLSPEEISHADPALDAEAVVAALERLGSEYEAEGRAFEVAKEGGGYLLLTRPEYRDYLDNLTSVPKTVRLSTPALETLAIVAYRQPLGRIEIEHVRGVGSAGVLRTLTERGLIETVGRGDGLGRPLLYGTTTRFLQHFGFESLNDLPKPADLPIVLAEDGERKAEGALGDDTAA